MNPQEAVELAEKLKKARDKWHQKDYSKNAYKLSMEALRDNEILFINNLLRGYSFTKTFTENEKQFALKLVRGADRL